MYSELRIMHEFAILNGLPGVQISFIRVSSHNPRRFCKAVVEWAPRVSHVRSFTQRVGSCSFIFNMYVLSYASRPEWVVCDALVCV